MNENTEAGVVAALAAKASGGHVVKTDDGREFLITPSGTSHQEVSDAYGLKLAKPKYIKQTVTIETADSLVDYVDRFKGADTVLFAEIAANRIVALLDYHPSVDSDVGYEASHVAHRARMELPFSQEWALWKGIDGKLMSQTDFARWLEENGGDVSAPDGADLLEICKDLQSLRKVNFKQAVRTASLMEDFQYTTETDARTTKGLELPTKFQLRIPVYFGDATTEVYAFLRWAISDDGALKLGIQLSRLEHVRQAVFKQIVMDIAGRTQCPAVFGKSEN